MSADFALVCDCRAALGESPVWSAAEQALYFVDIRGPWIGRFDPASGALTKLPQRSEIGCIGLAKSGGFIAGRRDGVWRLDAEGQELRQLADNPDGPETTRFNDGRTGPDGRFYLGTVDESRAGKARFFRYDRNGLAPLFGGMICSNGLAFSPDGGRMYHVDSPVSQVTSRSFDPATGEIGPAQLAIKVPDDPQARPDGAAMDAEGCYWVAIYGAGEVRRYAPGGELLGTWTLPVLCPTMPAFGGPDMRTLYVTTASSRRTAEEIARLPTSGGIFAMRVDVPGLPEPLFDDEV